MSSRCLVSACCCENIFLDIHSKQLCKESSSVEARSIVNVVLGNVLAIDGFMELMMMMMMKLCVLSKHTIYLQFVTELDYLGLLGLFLLCL